MNDLRLAALAALSSLSLLGCNVASADCVKGTAAPVAQPRTVDAFTGVSSHGSFDVRLTQGAARAVTVVAPPEIAGLITTTVKGGDLVIESTGCFSTSQTIRIDVTAPSFARVAVKGSGDVSATTPLRGPSFALAVAGSGGATLELQTERAAVTISGSGDAKLSGSSPDLSIEVSGSGQVDARKLAAATAKVSVAGSGDVRVNAARALTASVAGSGEVIYSGSPAVTKQVAGSGEVRPGT